MEQIIHSGALIFLAVLSADDIKEKKVSVVKVATGAAMALLSRIMTGHFSGIGILSGCLPGLFLLLLSIMTRESIGKGDGIVVVALGLWTDFQWTFLITCLAIWLAGMFALIRFICKRKEPIPFVPFLLLGMEVVLLYA